MQEGNLLSSSGIYYFRIKWETITLIFCLPIFNSVKHVYGYEVVPQAITDARLNAKINGIQNATFIQGDLNKIDENFGKNFPKPDIVISGFDALSKFLYSYSLFRLFC